MIMKVGEFVRRHIPTILTYCESNPGELTKLQDAQFCKSTFDINYPFCKPAAAVTGTLNARFYAKEHVVCGIVVRCTNDWYNPPTSKSLTLFQRYLVARGLAAENAAGDGINVPSFPDTALPTTAARGTKKSNSVRSGPRGRFKGNAIGNAQNLLVRNILSRLGDETFGAGDWEETVAAFDNKCAYCGAGGALVRDHVIPINKQALGEHRLGNLVPACNSCNSKKGQTDYRAFLAHDPERLAAIALHLQKHGYTPIGDQERLRQIIDMAHDELRQLADRYVAIINTVVQTNPARD